MWTIFRDFIEFVTILLLLYSLVFFSHEACGMDLSSLTRDGTHTPSIRKWMKS